MPLHAVITADILYVWILLDGKSILSVRKMMTCTLIMEKEIWNNMGTNSELFGTRSGTELALNDDDIGTEMRTHMEGTSCFVRTKSPERNSRN